MATLKHGWVGGLLLLAGCSRGYLPPSTLERMERGPTHCAAYCEKLDMTMGALVAVGRGVPACVCVPVTAPPAALGAEPSAAVVGAAVVVSDQQDGQEQQREQSTDTSRGP